MDQSLKTALNYVHWLFNEPTIQELQRDSMVFIVSLPFLLSSQQHESIALKECSVCNFVMFRKYFVDCSLSD